MPSIPIVTNRLILREFVEDDWKTVHAYGSDAEVVRYLPWGPNTEEESRANIQKVLTAQTEPERSDYTLAICLQQDGRHIGACRITVRSPVHRDADIGYVLHRQYWGRGLMTEAVRSLVSFGFGELDLHRIWATCDVDNLASARVLEKAGMTREGRLRDHQWQKGRWRDSHLYAVLENEWAATSSP